MANTLQFGMKKVDVGLAENYLEKIKSSIFPIGYQHTNEPVLDSCNNKIHYSVVDDVNKYTNDIEKDFLTKPEMFVELSEEIKKNTDLFCQLDHIVRKTPIDDNKIQLKLIEQQALYRSQINKKNKFGISCIRLNDDSPLLDLGLVVRDLTTNKIVVIQSTKQLAVLSYLFTEICRKVGFENVLLNLVENNSESPTEVTSGCVGVITERSDLESAIDVFIASTKLAPWKLNKIWVQECIYEEFKMALTRKCNVANQNSESSDRTLLADEITIEDKIFSLDSINPTSKATSDNVHIIAVEAYRTTKELISLIKAEHPYLSLWGSNISEVNEIVFAVPTPVVWINDYARFFGPPKASQAIYAHLSSQPLQEPKRILDPKKKNIWKALSNAERRNIVLNVLIDLTKTNEEVEFVNKLRQLINEVNRPDPYKFFDVENGKICLGIDTIPQNIVSVGDIDEDTVIQALLHGSNYTLFKECTTDHAQRIFKALDTNGVPVYCCLSKVLNNFELEDSENLNYPIARTKVIYSNYGTIFAN